ncbi:hypothetical protein [Fulvivirga sp.]|uniref:hypothetical protein n=1 Tax=Fulvivirga sp. TaxID=1931237 RepID=UPI0032ECD0AE
MKFEKNKAEPLHRWYPFVEGYSREFIEGIINELDYSPTCCLDPFVGSGTTPVQLQLLDIPCYSFEVSPFMYFIATTKLQRGYQAKSFDKSLTQLVELLTEIKQKDPILSPPNSETFVENSTLKKWLFDKSVMDGLLDIKYAISQIDDVLYRNVFKIALASILLTVSNVYRNGKCVAYKKNWQEENIDRTDVHNIFLEKIETVIKGDISELETRDKKLTQSNLDKCFNEDARVGVSKLKNNSIDLLITSPPYLNSRDYTDIYRLELWMLDMVKSHEDIRALREKTLISHVQIKHGNIIPPYVSELQSTMKSINANKENFWNQEIPNMINGYFRDLHYIFTWLSRKMKSGSRGYVNVANSMYFNIEIKVDEILADIIEQNGFLVEEIRIARYLSPSAHQNKANKLRESVIVFKT